MNKYHIYEVGSENYVCDLYGYTDFLKLQMFMQEKGTDIFFTTQKLSKKMVRKVFNTPDEKELASLQ